MLADAPGICQLPDLNRQKECEKECFGVRVCRRLIGCGEKEYDKCMGKCLSRIQVIDLTKTDGPSFGLVLPPCMSELQNSDAGSEPQCTVNGYYKPQQCLPARREWDMMFPPECQCVHYETGEEINGTKCRPEEKDCDKVDCNKFQDCNEDTEVFSTCGSSCADECRDGKVVMAGACNFMCEEGCFCREGYIHDTRTGECILEKECKTEQESAVGGAPAPVDVGPCLKLLQTARFAPGAEPKCTESGDFAPQKCQLILSGAWTSRFCWCQNSQTGDEIKGTRRGPGEKNVDCTIYHPEDDIEVIEGPKPSTGLILPPCIEKRLKADKNENGFEFALEVGPFIPKCSKTGDFEARQCIKDGEFSTCWCVNIKTGKEIPGTRYIRLPGSADANNCTEINEKMDSCGANQEFSSCGSACPDMCNEGTKMPPRICTFECKVGCFCREGYIRDKKTEECIPQKECAEKCYPTDNNGKTEERDDGEEWKETLTDGTVSNCKCTAPNISCSFVGTSLSQEGCHNPAGDDYRHDGDEWVQEMPDGSVANCKCKAPAPATCETIILG